MPTIRKFEDIQAWKDAIALADSIYAATREPSFARDFGLCDQMRRAAVSISSNIAEGFERESSQEFMRFLSIAKGSAGELRSQLYIARNLGYIDEDRFSTLYVLATETGRRLAHFIGYLQNDTQKRKFKGASRAVGKSLAKPDSNARGAGLERGNAASNGGEAALERGLSPLWTTCPNNLKG